MRETQLAISTKTFDCMQAILQNMKYLKTQFLFYLISYMLVYLKIKRYDRDLIMLYDEIEVGSQWYMYSSFQYIMSNILAALHTEIDTVLWYPQKWFNIVLEHDTSHDKIYKTIRAINQCAAKPISKPTTPHDNNVSILCIVFTCICHKRCLHFAYFIL